MSFLDGLLGIHKEPRSTPQDLWQQEQDRQVRHDIRRQYEDAQEIESLQEFLSRQPYYKVTLDRPRNFDEYIGQKNMKEMVIASLEACKIKKTPYPHTLFWAEAGLGKTTIAYLIAESLQANLIITSGGQLENKNELLNIFKQFRDDRKNILFIDEIHSIKRKISEMIYSAMEDFRLDFTTKSDRVISLNLPPFTLIGCTTNMANLLTPIRQRFQNRFHLEPYTAADLSLIIYAYLKRSGYNNVNAEIVDEISKRSRNVARYAIAFMKNILDYRLTGNKRVTVELVKEYFRKENIDSEGLNNNDRNYLSLLFEMKNYKAGLNTLVKGIGVDKKTVEEEIEPYLLRKRFITIGPGGRYLMELGAQYIVMRR